MKIHWHKLLAKTSLWLAGEILLNFMGLDTLANYSEFLCQHQEGLLLPYESLEKQAIAFVLPAYDLSNVVTVNT